MLKSTREKYSKTWLDFIDIQGITHEKEPVEQDFLDWFERSKASGHGYATLTCEHSHLNKVSKQKLIFNMIYFIGKIFIKNVFSFWWIMKNLK